MLLMGGRSSASLPVAVSVPAESAGSETFDAMATPRGRGGDLDSATWAYGRLHPDSTVIVQHATIPAGIRSTFTGGTSVYPPDDVLIQDASGARSARLMMPCVILEYGRVDAMYRRPFDFAGRTGRIDVDVDAWAQGNLGNYIDIAITDEPVLCTAFAIQQNEEPGPRPKNGMFIIWTNGVPAGATPSDPGVAGPTTIGSVLVYDDYVMTTVTPSFEVSGASRPSTFFGKLNRIQIDVSTTHLAVYESDYSTDDTTFPNSRLIYEADISLPFSRGYVHLIAHNHSTYKFDLPLTGIFYWDNFSFDGPVLSRPRAYEVPDNTTEGHAIPGGDPPPPEYDYMQLSYVVPDTPSELGPFSIASVDISGITGATLTLDCYMNSVSHTPDTTWALEYQFNSGTWRTRALTSAEVAARIADVGTAGWNAFAIDVPTGDLASGTNTLKFRSANAPTDLPMIICNIDLLVAA